MKKTLKNIQSSPCRAIAVHSRTVHGQCFRCYFRLYKSSILKKCQQVWFTSFRNASTSRSSGDIFVARCHDVKLSAHAPPAFRSRQYPCWQKQIYLCRLFFLWFTIFPINNPSHCALSKGHKFILSLCRIETASRFVDSDTKKILFESSCKQNWKCRSNDCKNSTHHHKINLFQSELTKRLSNAKLRIRNIHIIRVINRVRVKEIDIGQLQHLDIVWVYVDRSWHIHTGIKLISQIAARS